MFKSLIVVFAVVALVSCASTNTFYVVRHAEKAASNSNMTSDVPLSAAGTERADALRDLLKDKKIVRIYSTNYQRTKNTAAPLAAALGIPVETYNPADSAFFKKLRGQKGRTLIVGHSNTVDDVVGALMGARQFADLPDSQYGDLWILTKKGDKWTLSRQKFGK